MSDGRDGREPQDCEAQRPQLFAAVLGDLVRVDTSTSTGRMVAANPQSVSEMFTRRVTWARAALGEDSCQRCTCTASGTAVLDFG